MADFKHPCLKPLGVHLKARVIALQNFCKISNFLQNLVLIPQHSPFPTVPLSHKNPQHYQRSEFAAAHSRKVDFAMAHSHLTTCIAPSLNPDRPTILRKSATFSNCKSAAHFRPPSTQLKLISIFLKGKFEAAHSRKVGTVSGDPPQNLHSTIVKLRPFHYPTKIRNIIKGRNLQRLTAALQLVG